MNSLDPHALRTSIEARLANRADELGVDINRLRRHFVFQRMLVRLGKDGRWVLKGGFALEARLLTDARATKDLDLVVLDTDDGALARQHLIDTLDTDHDDGLIFLVGPAKAISADEGGNPGWRFSVDASTAGRTFSSVRVDVVSRPEEIAGGVENITVQPVIPANGMSAADIAAVDVAQHAAEKLHAITRTYGTRLNTRVKDLVDVVLLHEAGLLDEDRVALRLYVVHVARGGSWPPGQLVDPPRSWVESYEAARDELGLSADFDGAVAIATHLYDHATNRGDVR